MSFVRFAQLKRKQTSLSQHPLEELPALPPSCRHVSLGVGTGGTEKEQEDKKSLSPSLGEGKEGRKEGKRVGGGG